ncbi:MAG: NAD-dependent epimerase [Anaerolinea sp.]|nr:NAD-dependent epimerase [Anaerolinea sp.]
MPQNKILIAGASGLVGQAAVEHFASLPAWEVVGVSRRKPVTDANATFLSIDLTDREACQRAFGQMGDVTHVVYAALQEDPGLMPGWLDPTLMERNLAMLRNLFDPLLEVAAGLQHVSLMHGTKAYGLHHPAVASRVKVPLREREPRLDHPNFYFLQEDYLRGRQAAATWAMTVFRPTVIYGGAAGNNMNPILPIAVYAALLKDAGEPLHFPGTGSTPNLHEAVDAELVARALAWAATSDAARNETFNLTNGDVFLWSGVWPAIAGALGMEAGESRPTSLAEELPKRQAQWAALVEKHRLAANPDLVTFVGQNSLIYTDMVLGRWTRPGIPYLNSTIKARQAGFHYCIDTEDMFVKWLRRLQQERLIPLA